jgi:mannose-1-phosphate guanylyltransferase
VALTYAVEPEPLDTAGAIRFAADAAGIDETFIVANGDILTDLDVADLVACHRRLGAEATLHLIGVEDPSAFGVVDLAADGRVRAFVEKPAPGTEPSNLINAGTYVFEPSVLDRIPSGERVSVERDTFPKLVEAGSLYGYATDDYWIDAGRPELYRAANLDLLNGARRSLTAAAVDATATVDPRATVTNSIIGAHAAVGAGARVVDSVVLPAATVADRATVERSVVMGRVGPDANVVDSMVGEEGAVAAGQTLVTGAEPPVER